jgi:hypothetical protein
MHLGRCSFSLLGGISVEHVGSTGQDIVRAVVALASDMYPGKQVSKQTANVVVHHVALSDDDQVTSACCSFS